jgi:UDP-N-acetylglucosamine acyltransferase
MTFIHPTALVSNNAKLGENISIGAHSIIYDDVLIGNNTIIGNNSVIYNGARIGNNVKIFNNTSIAHIPQDKKFNQEYSLLFIGDNSTIYDFATLHRGTEATGRTVIGENVIISQYSHIAHDCVIGNCVFIGHMVQIGGHVEIDEYSVLEDFTSVHQFCKLGKYILLRTSYKASMDIPPFISAEGKPLKFSGLNFEAFKKYKFDQKKIDSLNLIYSILYFSGLNFSQAKEKIIHTFTDDDVAEEVLKFLNKSTRGIIGK